MLRNRLIILFSMILLFTACKTPLSATAPIPTLDQSSTITQTQTSQSLVTPTSPEATLAPTLMPSLTPTATLTPTPTGPGLEQTTTPTLVFPTAGEGPDPNQAVGKVLFEEKFDGSSGWNWGYSEPGVVEFRRSGGALIAQAESSQDGWRISSGPAKFQAGNQQISLTIQAVVCAGNDEWGLLFRATFPEDKINGYLFRLNCAGKASLILLKENQETVLLAWSASSAIQVGAGATNRMTVWAGKDELRLYVNDRIIGVVKDGSYSQGEYGLYIYDKTNGNAEVHFSDLVVKEVNLP